MLDLFEGKTTSTYAEAGRIGYELFGLKAFFDGDWKILWMPKPFGKGDWEVFNLKYDPGELDDLSKLYPDRRKTMIALWEQYKLENGVLDISLEEWEETLLVNLTGPFLFTQALIPLMKKNGYGRIVNISSSAGRSVSTLGGAHYTASKAGLLGFTRAVAKEVAASGITVNAVCPGLIDTQMARETTTRKELEMFLESFPIKRLGLPEEIGNMVLFLCSEKASYITGASIDINGGDLMI